MKIWLNSLCNQNDIKKIQISNSLINEAIYYFISYELKRGHNLVLKFWNLKLSGFFIITMELTNFMKKSNRIIAIKITNAIFGFHYRLIHYFLMQEFLIAHLF